MRYALTLEHDTKPTITVRGATEDPSESKALNKALREAERVSPMFPWTSLCFVVEKPRIAKVSRGPKERTDHLSATRGHGIDRQPAAS